MVPEHAYIDQSSIVNIIVIFCSHPVAEKKPFVSEQST